MKKKLRDLGLFTLKGELVKLSKIKVFCTLHKYTICLVFWWGEERNSSQ